MESSGWIGTDVAPCPVMLTFLAVSFGSFVVAAAGIVAWGEVAAARILDGGESERTWTGAAHTADERTDGHATRVWPAQAPLG